MARAAGAKPTAAATATRETSSSRMLRTVLCTGALMSECWLLLQILITRIHQADSEIVNNAGRVRYHTQNIGMLLLSERFLPELAVGRRFHARRPVDTFDALDATLASLRGERPGAGGEAVSPRAVDPQVRQRLAAWGSHFVHFRELHGRARSLSDQEVAEAMDSINSATLAMDEIVDFASRGARHRVRLIASLCVVRIAAELIWALLVAWGFLRAWCPGVKAYNACLELEQQQRAMLQAAFDAVVLVQAEAPFAVLRQCAQLDDLAGRPMCGRQVCALAAGADERRAMEDLFGTLQPQFDEAGLQERGFPARLRRLAARWRRELRPRGPAEGVPVPRMLRTAWRCGAREEDAPAPETKVEVLLAGQPMMTEDGSAALLAVRRCGPYEAPQGCWDVEMGSSRGGGEAQRAESAASCVRQHLLQVDFLAVPPFPIRAASPDFERLVGAVEVGTPLLVLLQDAEAFKAWMGAQVAALQNQGTGVAVVETFQRVVLRLPGGASHCSAGTLNVFFPDSFANAGGTTLQADMDNYFVSARFEACGEGSE